MASEREEELISAYLDGEVTDQERATVESWLADNAELRQLHDELRSLRVSIQSLPRHQLQQDLSPQVLRQAEREVLKGAASHESEKATLAIPDWLRRDGVRRYFWPTVAVAAALALMVLDGRERDAERQVAQAPESDRAPMLPSTAKRAAPADAQIGPRPTAIAKDATVSAPAESLDSLSSDAKVKANAGAVPPSMADKVAMPAPRAVDAPLEAKSAAPDASPAVPAMKAAAESIAADKPAAKNESLDFDEQTAEVVIDVTPEYLEKRGFEKLLNGMKISWQNQKLPEAAVAGATADQRRDESPAANAQLRQGYVVKATPEQVDVIVSELRKQSSAVKRVQDQQQRNRFAQRRAAANPPPDGEQRADVPNQRSNVITNNFLLQAPQAEPAAPAAAVPPPK